MDPESVTARLAVSLLDDQGLLQRHRFAGAQIRAALLIDAAAARIIGDESELTDPSAPSISAPIGSASTLAEKLVATLDHGSTVDSIICRGAVTQWDVAEELVADGSWESLPAFLRRYRRYLAPATEPSDDWRESAAELIALTNDIRQVGDELREQAAAPRHPSIDWLLPTVVDLLIEYRYQLNVALPASGW